MTLSNRSDRADPKAALAAIIKSNRQQVFFFVSGITGFLAAGSLLKYQDFQAGIGLFIVLALIAVAIFGFYSFAKVIAKHISLPRQKERVVIALSMVPALIVIVLVLTGLFI